MPMLKPTSARYTTEEGLRIVVQVPEAHVEALADAVLAEDPLVWGDYDCVDFRSASGSQHFRSLGTGRNPATAAAVAVACVELSFFLTRDEARLTPVLDAIHAAHPYEEPVIFVTPCLRTRHIRGADEDNPNRFWNRAPEDWVPEEHRPVRGT